MTSIGWKSSHWRFLKGSYLLSVWSGHLSAGEQEVLKWMERSFGKKLCQGGEEKRGGYKLVKSFVFFLRPVRENLGCTTEEKKLPSILLFWANNAEKKVMVEHQSWKEFLQHSSSNPIKLFALLWIPRNPAIGILPSRLKLDSIYLNRHPAKCIKIELNIS